MIIIHVMGGLGNQLYQYAMYCKLKKLGKKVKLDTRAYEVTATNDKEWRSLELDWLDSVSYEVCSDKERILFRDSSMKIFSRIRRKLFGRKDRMVKENACYMPEVYDMDEVYLYGYWACEKYYEDMIPQLQNTICFPKSLNEKNDVCMNQMKHENSVSIHIRRTDYLEVADGKRYMGICTEEYYDAAIRYIKEHVENSAFYVFSDDVAYAKEHFQDDHMHIVDWNTGRDSMFDMQLMSCCKHNICANSTFSEWGARLNTNPDKIMIRPLHHDNYETMDAKEIQNLWKNWVLIDSLGNVR